uniref:COMM domain-containing protein n=1 Tax=Peronospora matthiolae TaxID=2874970 RepID=A0AAV1TMY5_9STRA
MPSLVLQKTDWRLHLQMGSSKRAGYLQPMAIFQLDVMDERSKTKQVWME